MLTRPDGELQLKPAEDEDEDDEQEEECSSGQGSHGLDANAFSWLTPNRGRRLCEAEADTLSALSVMLGAELPSCTSTQSEKQHSHGLAVSGASLLSLSTCSFPQTYASTNSSTGALCGPSGFGPASEGIEPPHRATRCNQDDSQQYQRMSHTSSRCWKDSLLPNLLPAVQEIDGTMVTSHEREKQAVRELRYPRGVRHSGSSPGGGTCLTRAKFQSPPFSFSVHKRCLW